MELIESELRKSLHLTVEAGLSKLSHCSMLSRTARLDLLKAIDEAFDKAARSAMVVSQTTQLG